MENKYKDEAIYKTIGQVAKELDLIDKKTGQLKTYTIRYWETQFKQIRPSIKAGGRRYYSGKDLKIIRYIKFLLKEKGLTIDGVNKKTGQTQTHTIRYWETQFKQIKPTIKAGGRRYYSKKDIKIISYIKFLLKDKGLTINGVKKMLNEKGTHSIDDSINLGVYKPGLKNTKLITEKIKNISKIIKELKKLKNG